MFVWEGFTVYFFNFLYFFCDYALISNIFPWILFKYVYTSIFFCLIPFYLPNHLNHENWTNNSLVYLVLPSLAGPPLFFQSFFFFSFLDLSYFPIPSLFARSCTHKPKIKLSFLDIKKILSFIFLFLFHFSARLSPSSSLWYAERYSQNFVNSRI